jgi:hypothetical protein
VSTETLPTDLEALTKEVRKLKRIAADAAMALHDVAEECPARWQEIPEKAEEAYARHTAYFEAKAHLESLEAGS